MGFELLLNIADIFIAVIKEIAWFAIFPAIGGTTVALFRNKLNYRSFIK